MTMEIDMHSPSFRTMRSYSSKKRARSPNDSPSPSDRHTKRLAVATGSGILPQQPSHLSGFQSNASLSSSSAPRRPSDDWVQQTGGLTIDSPLFRDADESMSVDDQPAETSSGAPDQRPIIQISTPESTQYHPSYGHPPPPFTPTDQAQPQSDVPQPPSINIHPATPSAPFQAAFPNTQLETTSSDPFQTALPASPTATRKQRFTMGPRSDCEKCKLGAKGHWMHFD
ncbi:hypothetical protein PLICRDRAFT_40615 [Plicaturopsis crispa FD-325 SS-3]|nr:hypothetical protein PLICRDRAFT_40615 [Plicaturopsis crispa FD-325 SS-3]